MARKSGALALTLGLLVGTAVFAQTEPSDGAAGASSPGYAGMEEREDLYLAGVRRAVKKGKSSREYINSLVDLGMHYNRTSRFRDATRVLRQALAIVDSGVLKPMPMYKRVPERNVEMNSGNGVVGVEVVRQSMPYEELMENLLPQLVSAEIGANDLAAAEAHVKRQIKFAATNEVTGKLNLMSAYSSYAEIMRKLNRRTEADAYQRKADEINASFKPL